MWPGNLKLQSVTILAKNKQDNKDQCLGFTLIHNCEPKIMICMLSCN